ncbi:hypothetical protein SUDANB146_01208 [Streptomyces sp. enrichment culture]
MMPWAASAAGPARSAGRETETGRPSLLNPAISVSIGAVIAWGAGGSSTCMTATRRRSADWVSRAVRRANASASAVRSGLLSPILRAASTDTTTEVRWCALMSCNSPASRSRSASAACACCCSAPASSSAVACRSRSQCRRPVPRADTSEPVGEEKTADAVPCGRLQELDDGDSRGRAQADGPAAQNGGGEQRHHDRQPRYQAQQVGWRQDLSHHGHRDDDAQGGERCPVTPIERHRSERRGTEGGDPRNGVRRLLRRSNDAEPQQQLRSHEQYRQWPDPTTFPHWRKCMAGRRPPRHRGVQGVTRCRPCGRATVLCPAD